MRKGWFAETINGIKPLFKDLYFIINSSVEANNPTAALVSLRDDIVDLVENRRDEATGTTNADEYYVLCNGPQQAQHTLVRVCKERVVEYTYFPPGWLSEVHRIKDNSILEQPLVIEGDPFTITRSTGNASAFLTVESKTK